MPDASRLPPFEPPAGFVQQESAVEGVSVWAPAPPDPDATEAPEGTYRCAKCGAAVGYEVAAGAVACTFCGHVVEASSEQVGTGAATEVFTDDRIAEAARTWELQRQELHCESCGVDIQIVEGALTAQCAFCGSSQVLVRQGLVSGLRPHAVLPFQVEGDALQSRVHTWLSRGWMHPSDLSEKALLERFVGVYVPWWTFSARVGSRWRAQVGIDKTRRVYRDGEWKTEHYTDWEWREGVASTRVDDLPVLGTSRVPDHLAGRVDRYELDDLVDYHPDVLAGWQAQAFDRGLMEAWDVGRAAMRERAKADCRSAVGMSKVRRLSVAADFDDERWRYVLLPLHLAAYTYEGEVYRVLVNGQTGALAGQKPVVWPRVYLAIAACFAPGVLVGLVGLPLALIGIGLVLLALAAVLLILGGIGAVMLVKHAKDAEARP